MSLKRKLSVAAAAAGIAPVLLVVLPVEQASAHGYISTPGSRQAQCAAGVVSCGSIKFEPQSVEGPQGLSSCNGGLSQFAELNDDSKPWRATSVGGTVDFTWTFTARHATSNYEYFLNGRKIATVDGGGKQPPSTVTHSVNLAGASGRQKLLAVWNIADTPNAFYSCVDLQVGGGSTQPPTTQPTTNPPTTTQPTTAPPTTAPPTSSSTPKPPTTTQPPSSGDEWKPGTAYETGAEVTYEGARYRVIQRHTSLAGWEPTSTPALWQKL
ncbi:cellulose-binding protein [Actinosynnema sp. ALI-1.44]|uniref:lytic polysaccharide monooxygenase n=1 Tax=Actinosynnema sp. ALI-1.44 TaxID=1933779 RepID=UPI00097C4933|nr:lytic polysaccharide monooxygenase [Actinosynnema sp. ALI-1.44]ONI84143.1 cellulose-binding protein [Actinosynnema sp. ALI-1.44]